MSKLTEYIAASVGYDGEGLPASTVQFTFGMSPFQIAETEDIGELTEITTVCQCDAVIDLKIIDDICMISFDFSMEADTFVELVQELEMYNQQKDHVTNSLNSFMNQYELAERNADEKKKEELYMQMKVISVPFMLPTILPIAFGGTVHIGFADDPKFVFFTSDKINQQPFKITMIFAAKDLFCQDEVGIYFEDTEEEIRAQQEELWYMQEARKMEEESYQAQYGSNVDLYDGEEQAVDKRLKGVRIK